MTEPPMSSPPPRDWREARREERYERRLQRFGTGGGAWIGGVILIALGAIFLAQNFGYPLPRNWWALFILLPALGCFGGAWSIYQRQGGMTPAATRMILSGLILVGLAAIFLFGVDLGKFWPVILIALGVGALLSGGRPRSNRPP